MKILLMVPNYRWIEGDESTLWHFIPYNLCLLAAIVREDPEVDVEIEVLDSYHLELSPQQLDAELKKRAPDVVGITVMMDQYAPAGHQAAAITRKALPNATIAMGGVYVTVNAKMALEDTNIDYGLMGEGEYTFRGLIRYLQGKGELPDSGLCYRNDDKIIDTGRAELIRDLDLLPLPAYDLIDFRMYSQNAPRKSVDSPAAFPYARIMTSRGCPYGCVFCQVEIISGSRFRPRSAESVLEEIKWLRDEYGIKSIVFDDDNLFTDKKRAKAIFQGMIDLGLVMPWSSIATAVFRLDDELIPLMRKSGCRYICIAIESGCERVLKEVIGKPVSYDHAKLMVKAARKEGIFVAANFIVGFPTETWDEIRESIDFAANLDVDYVKLFHAIPLRHTRLWDLCVETGSFKSDFVQEDISWHTGQIQTEHFSSHDLTVLRAYEWDRINFTDPDKRKRTAKLMGITEAELLEVRRSTLDSVKERMCQG